MLIIKKQKQQQQEINRFYSENVLFIILSPIHNIYIDYHNI